MFFVNIELIYCMNNVTRCRNIMCSTRQIPFYIFKGDTMIIIIIINFIFHFCLDESNLSSVVCHNCINITCKFIDYRTPGFHRIFSFSNWQVKFWYDSTGFELTMVCTQNRSLHHEAAIFNS